MSAQPNLENIFKVIEGGKAVTDTSKVVKFTADNGKVIGDCIKTSAKMGNGSTLTIFNKVATGASGLVTAGLGFLAMDVGVVGMCLAPVLGLIGGAAITAAVEPVLFERLVNDLTAKGKTVGGKIIGYIDPNTNNIAFDDETVDIFKDAYIDGGYFNKTLQNIPLRDVQGVKYLPNYTPTPLNTKETCKIMAKKMIDDILAYDFSRHPSITTDIPASMLSKLGEIFNENYIHLINGLETWNGRGDSTGDISSDPYVARCSIQFVKKSNTEITTSIGIAFFNTGQKQYVSSLKTSEFTNIYGESVSELQQNYALLGDSSKCDRLTINAQITFNTNTNKILPGFTPTLTDNVSVSSQFKTFGVGDYTCEYYKSGSWAGPTFRTMMIGGCNPAITKLQDNAVAPQANVTINNYYPNYLPLQQPQYIIGDFPNLYPAPLPSLVNPSLSQQQAQNPDNSAQLDLLLDLLLDILPAIENSSTTDPDPIPDPEPQPDPLPDPDPNPDPEPLPENPDDPNLSPELDGSTMLPTIPETVATDSLFKVYNPTASQLNELGSFLWSTNILDQIIKIWQNPLDGIISLSRVYATPQTGEEKEIVLGNIGSSVNSKILSNQFATINCGTVKIPELKNNATDYSPFTSISIYLPFIGIMELDSNEVMNSEITLYYHIDFYTGTCLAEIYVKRDCDLVTPKVLYTFTGNCSQSIPLTSSDARGLASSLLSLGSIAIGTASGGGIAVAAAHRAASEIGAMANQEMQHVSHSGALSSNAGIMGQKKPYIIISRQQSYDANAYSELYGFPANSTVYLCNCNGYQKIKAIHLKSKATGEEKKEIEKLLFNGIIV